MATEADRSARREGRLGRSTAATSIAAAMSIASGLGLDLAIAAAFGAGRATDAFFVAVRIPVGITAFVLSAATQVLVPPFTVALMERGWRGSAGLLSNVLVVVVGAAAALAALGALLAAPLVDMTAPGLTDAQSALAADLARLMFVLVPMTAATEVFRAVLNSHDRFAVPALFNVALNSVAAVVVVVSDDIRDLPVAYLLGGATQVLLAWTLARRAGFRFRPRPGAGGDELRGIWRASGGPLGGSMLQLVARLGEQLMVSFLPGGSITILNYGNRLMSALGGSVFFRSVVVTVMPRLSRQFARGDHAELSATVRQGTRIMVRISIPLAVFSAVLAAPAVGIAFRRGDFTGRDAELLALVVAAYAASLVGAALQRIFLAPFFASRDSSVYFRNTAYGVLVNLALIPPLMTLIGESDVQLLAVPIAYAFAQAVNVVHAQVRMRQALGIRLDRIAPVVRANVLAGAAAAASMLLLGRVLDLSALAPRAELVRNGAVVAVVGAAAFVLALLACTREHGGLRRVLPLPGGGR